MKDWLSTIKCSLVESKMHVLVCKEVVDFLLSQSSYPLARKIYIVAMADLLYQVKTYNNAILIDQGNLTNIWAHAVYIISTTFWVKEFAKLQKQGGFGF